MEQTGQLPKWTTGADCKSAGWRLRRFESFTVHFTLQRQREGTAALIAQLVERILGKNEVIGPNPIEGSCRNIEKKINSHYLRRKDGETKI